jgi:hypothetical protein
MLKGIIDLHIHTAPDVRPRRFNDLELAQLALQTGAAGIVLKGHHFPTTRRAKATQSLVSGIRVMGGIVLNEAMGGLTPAVVAQACAEGARIVWMPTLDAANHRRHEGKSGGIEIAPDGVLRSEVHEILGIIAHHDIALATGHLAPAEIRLVTAAAAAAGVRRIIVTHPEHRVTGLSIADQQALVRDLPVYFERCYAQPAGGGRYLSNLDVNLAAIQALGPGSTVLASDSGQVESAPWDVAWAEVAAYLSAHGISENAFDRMAKINPAFLCGLADSDPAQIPPSR